MNLIIQRANINDYKDISKLWGDVTPSNIPFEHFLDITKRDELYVVKDTDSSSTVATFLISNIDLREFTFGNIEIMSNLYKQLDHTQLDNYKELIINISDKFNTFDILPNLFDNIKSKHMDYKFLIMTLRGNIKTRNTKDSLLQSDKFKIIVTTPLAVYGEEDFKNCSSCAKFPNDNNCYCSSEIWLSN